MSLASRDRVCVDPAGPWRRLKSARSPSTIDEQTSDGRLANNWTSIRANVDRSRPLTVHPHATEYRKQLHDCGHCALNYG